MKNIIINMRLLAEGCNKHYKFSVTELPSIKIIDGVKYTIKTENLFKIRRSILKRIYDFIILRQGHYLILFQEGIDKPIKNTSINVTPRILLKVKNSRILGNMMKELFKDMFLNKGRIAVILFIIVAAIATYGYFNGWFVNV